MDSKELRIGNYFFRGKVVLKSKAETPLQIQNGVLKNAKPIPLTEEWLVKFGINCLSDGVFIFKIGYTQNIVFQPDMKCNYKCEHVHQLQNLYFALTGEELTLKL